MGEKPTTLEVLLGIPVLGAIIIGVMLLHAIVLRDLWRWFVTPLGVPGIGLFHAMGLSTLYGFIFCGLQYRLSLLKTKPNGDSTWFGMAVAPFTFSAVYCLVAWGFGAIEAGLMAR